jgi:hypothetical protein
MIKSFAQARPLWSASVEAFVLSDHTPKVRELLAGAMQEGRSGFAADLSGVPEDDVDENTVRALGSVQLALTSGIMLQWLADPDSAPNAEDVVAGLRAMVARLE